MDHVILNHGQVTWTAPELAPPLLTTPPHEWEHVSALDRFSVHRCRTRSSLATREREYRFNLSSDDNRVGVWRPRGERLNPAFALQRHTTPTAGVMVWVPLPTIHGHP
ncbi:uncharacterized protein TNCV_2278751 [Trichonephila clavipes]|uniref:Uncharacterized protein n=1 Tax=Trichonephila clavipes TaxID=2585209 RepID=A0A8X6RF73_TRICX|nr:uncharacterized protein TNCV_2278751 [Trichonephila clavipes]